MAPNGHAVQLRSTVLAVSARGTAPAARTAAWNDRNELLGVSCSGLLGSRSIDCLDPKAREAQKIEQHGLEVIIPRFQTGKLGCDDVARSGCTSLEHPL